MRVALEKRLAALRDVVEVESFEVGKPVPKTVLARAERALGRALPRSLRTLYEDCNGVSLHWGHKESEAEGRISIWPLEQMFGGYEGTRRKSWDDDVFRGRLWLDDFEDDLDAATVATFKRLRPLELHEDEPPTCLDFGRSGRTSKKGQQEEPVLYLVDRWRLDRLPLTLPQYLEALIECLGLYGWKRAFFRPKSGDAERFQRQFPAIFGDPEATSVIVPAVGRRRKTNAPRKNGAAKGKEPPKTKEPGARVFIAKEDPVRAMVHPRGTIREVKAKHALVTLDLGLDVWVPLRKLELQKHDEIEKLREAPARFSAYLDDAARLTKLVTKMAPPQRMRLGVSLEAIVYDGPRPPNLGVDVNSPHLFGLVRALAGNDGASLLLDIIDGLLIEAAAEPTRSHEWRPSQYATNLALSALVLQILHERETTNGVTGLAGHWAATLVKRLEALCARLQEAEWLADSDGKRTVKFLLGCVRRIPGRATEFLRGSDWEKAGARSKGLSDNVLVD
jgi:hypothetical protein